ncbi:DNA internalization-related competence protein ComEC/Rec2 [Leucothrix mucor]|uniref:DNA internalization-related competence protein ComEC/Rec2 n=1 Tax=Leucothrix mucor TaxID=45248 RepID=UPI0003B3B1DC|nr:DNA internalization-related competence protein ComEC/Rec2 [Leucothrix mucor]
MRMTACGLLLGSLLVLSEAALLNSSLITIILLVTLFTSMYLLYRRVSSWLIGLPMLIVGFCITSLVASWQLDHAFPAELEGQSLQLDGTVVSLVDKSEQGIRFLFKVDDSELLDTKSSAVNADSVLAQQWSGLVRLGVYQNPPPIKAGERWRLEVRLKRPNGFANPSGFDYEKWLFSQGIMATGYVRSSSVNKRIETAPWYSIHAWRAQIYDQITRLVTREESQAIMLALTIADKNLLSTEQWDTLRATGTNHLMAISGLHIGLVAGFGVLLVWAVWWCFPQLSLWIPQRIAGSVLGVVLATVYALLAGFTIPTQRALVMVIVALVLMAYRYHYSPSRVLALAMIAVILWDPLAVMSVGFYLSFAAVGFILWTLSRSAQAPKFQMLRLQAALSLLMLPLGLLFFGEGSLVSPIANLIAIPWVSLIVVPFSLLAVVLATINEPLAVFVFQFVALHLDGLFVVLDALAALPHATVHFSHLPLWLSLGILLAGILWLLPRGLTWRYASGLLLLPLLLFQVVRPSQSGDFWLTVLDVGQGLSIVVETSGHTLVYDTGDKTSDSFDLGRMVLVPYLQHRAIESIDTLIVSHDDRDHSGGLQSVLKMMPVEHFYSSRDGLTPERNNLLCQQGQSWQWDGVQFEFLHPLEDAEGSDNDLSCVLKISNNEQSVLLTGDIHKKAEKSLLKLSSDQLQSSIVLMPHHGSNSSSTKAFIKAVNPEWALASAGYRSRYRHPHPKVLARYNDTGVSVLSTALHGALQFRVENSKKLVRPITYRQRQARFWTRKNVE